MVSTADASVPDTDVGPDAVSDGDVRASATPPPASTSSSRTPTRANLRSTGPPPAYDADPQRQRRAGQRQRCDQDRRRVGPVGRAGAGPGRVVEPRAARGVVPGGVVAVVLAAAEEPRVLDRRTGQEHRAPVGTRGRLDGEVVGPAGRAVVVVLPA